MCGFVFKKMVACGGCEMEEDHGQREYLEGEEWNFASTPSSVSLHTVENRGIKLHVKPMEMMLPFMATCWWCNWE